jgi:hypothetical protein
MAFTIYGDWWAPLAQQLGGDGRLSEFSPGDAPDESPGDQSMHPRVDESGAVATSAISAALLQQYTPESIAIYDASVAAAADLRRHARALALYDLTSYAGKRPDDVDVANTNALGWLKNVREGSLTVEGLVGIGSSGGTGSGGVSYRARVKVFDESNDEYAYRNEGI